MKYSADGGEAYQFEEEIIAKKKIVKKISIKYCLNEEIKVI